MRSQETNDTRGHFEADNPLFNYLPIFECCVVWCETKQGYQKKPRGVHLSLIPRHHVRSPHALKTPYIQVFICEMK